MCVRFDKENRSLIRWAREEGVWIPELHWDERIDAFPGRTAPVVLPDHEGHARALVEAQWGLQPFWAKRPDWGRLNAYNARSETVTEKPTFRGPFKSQRCIVPATAFYERDNGRWVRLKPARGVFAIAGLYEQPNEHTVGLPTFTMITTEPNGKVAQMHDRMPVMLDEEGTRSWLDKGTSREYLLRLLTPCPDEWLEPPEDAGPVGGKRTSAVEQQETLI